MKATFSQKTELWRAIPISEDCVYNEIIYDGNNKILVIFSKEKYKGTTLEPKLNQAGNVQYIQGPKDVAPTGIKQEKVLVENHYKYEVTDQDDILWFVKTFIDDSEKLIDYINTSFTVKEEAKEFSAKALVKEE